VQVVGVDGYRRGWVAVSLVEGRFERVAVHPHIDVVRAAYPDAVCIGVDIPLGEGPRAADIEARGFVGPRRSSVLPAPGRQARAAMTFAETGGGTSRQAFALVPKILEVEQAAAEDTRIFEVHPEVSFCKLKGAHLEEPKTTWNGFMERRRLLAGAGIEIPDDLDFGIPLIDVLDAAVAAWSAARCASGSGENIVETIWY
jgi:predicted RNase H-like nuclease